jgi:mono/diheme cytochrome c family protein
MRNSPIAFAVMSLLALSVETAIAADAGSIARGEYLIKISGCNDCHTPGYPETGGQVTESTWLTGNPVGFHGPWGTSYPTNLRRLVQDLSEADWLTRVRQPMRPPMPWFNLRDMTDDDLVAIYRFIRSLGPAGEAAPMAMGPGEPVKTAYIEFVPKDPANQDRVR